MTFLLRLWRAFPFRPWAIFALLAAVLLFGIAWCARDARQDAKRSEAGQTLASGRTAAAGDASAIRDRADVRNDQITDAVKKGTDDVRQAPDRDAANRAARLGVCRIDPSAHADCRVLLAAAGRVD